MQPVVFHRIMETVPAAAWQIVHDSDGLTILLAGPAPGHNADGLAARVQRELGQLGVGDVPIRVERVDAIPRTALGKAPLIRSAAAQPRR